MADETNSATAADAATDNAQLAVASALPARPAGPGTQTTPGLVWHNGKLKKYNPAEHGAKFEIRTPAPGFNGERAGVVFRDGVGFTDDEDLVPWFTGQKYEVIDLGAAAPSPKRRGK